MVSQIIRYDGVCKIADEEDGDFLKKLDRHLSFVIQGAEHTQAFKGYINERGEEVTWDGRHHLLTTSLKFPSGLLERVQKLYASNNKPLNIVDARRAISPPSPIDISSKLESLKKIPHSYQEEVALTAINNSQGIIRMATGSGKSLTAALITAKLGKKTIIYVIGKDLLYQLHSFFSSVFDDEIGIIGDGKCEIRDVNIATIWSVGQALGLKKSAISLDDDDSSEKEIDKNKFRAIKEMLLTSSTIIFDECHLAACNTVQTIYRNSKAEHIYGMSASPWRDDNADLLIEGVLGNKIVDISAKWLIERGYLVEPVIRFLAVPPKKCGKNYQAVYAKYITQNDERNSLILTASERLVEQGFQTLVLFHSIKHGEILYEKISKKLPCALLSGKDKKIDRDRVKSDLESGKIKCIIASKIFDIGVDLPSLSGLIVAGGGKSSVRALQRVGRVIRKYPGKKQAAVIDFADQAPHLIKHSKIRRDIYSEEFNVSWPEKKES